MRQPSITALLIIIFTVLIQFPAYGSIQGGIQYSIPTDYSKLSEAELEARAKKYFYLAQKLDDRKINEDMTNALMLYTILQRVNPENIDYCVKLGILYDQVDLDRYAKGNFSRAISINKTKPEPYFYFGEYYYARQSYRNALKYYKKAYNTGYNKNYDLLYKMGDIYEKFGDTRSALKYLLEASSQNPNEELDNKIKRIDLQNNVNKEYYSNTRIRG